MTKNKDINIIARKSALGKKSLYISNYDSSLLYAISRREKREELGINPINLPFFGVDSWNHYEVSWLNNKGKPCVGIAHIIYDCSSPKIIESKSFKLYFNSFNNTKFESASALEKIIKQDVEKYIEAPVFIEIHPLNSSKLPLMQNTFSGENIDSLDIECSTYDLEPSFLTTSNEVITETLCSDLLKSNCLITYQPDWGSIQIRYSGNKINREGLLKYLVSFRNHNEFHEQCIERIFMDILRNCKPSKLTVYARYTRRGGLDINPYRSTEKTSFNDENIRLSRQ